jgi:hypothetical protein
MNGLYALGFIACCYVLAVILRKINIEFTQTAPRPAALQPRPTLSINVTPYVPSANQQPTRQSRVPSISGTAPGSTVRSAS